MSPDCNSDDEGQAPRSVSNPPPSLDYCLVPAIAKACTKRIQEHIDDTVRLDPASLCVDLDYPTEKHPKGRCKTWGRFGASRSAVSPANPRPSRRTCSPDSQALFDRPDPIPSPPPSAPVCCWMEPSASAPGCSPFDLASPSEASSCQLRATPAMDPSHGLRHDSEDLPRAQPSRIASFPAELLMQIFQQFVPHYHEYHTLISRESTVLSLYHCTLVSRRWHSVAQEVLWKCPRVYTLGQLEALADFCSTDRPDTLGRCRSLRPEPTTAENYHLVRSFTLTATLSEQHRNHHSLSKIIPRFLMHPNIHLTVLDVSFLRGLSNYALMKCCPYLRSVVALNLAGGNRSAICITKCISSMPKLTRLSVAWNANVDDMVLYEIGEKCLGLEWIDLSGCVKIGDSGLFGLARLNNWTEGARGLRFVDLSFCSNITYVGVLELVERCVGTLDVLNVIGCGDVGLGKYATDPLPAPAQAQPGSYVAPSKTQSLSKQDPHESLLDQDSGSGKSRPVSGMPSSPSPSTDPNATGASGQPQEPGSATRSLAGHKSCSAPAASADRNSPADRNGPAGGGPSLGDQSAEHSNPPRTAAGPGPEEIEGEDWRRVIVNLPGFVPF
ncbi:uncharacterized protein BJ171DRAFT_221192 [Polychytrium aggregatum]|uniref:uncharacterized protein n=1 Tax=Polychytrium aggregatum TaxID=110093 RepID=UPI0022FED72E|nr:uncharacterized protein BJ171DRAFT_221192 [Polychytrium aggregatum]KAI9197468.1 hypothetical protein BJ171DRAFT_221192 [Polychytrium aggregatum]